MTSTGWARAHANIALAKYWGKTDTQLNLPAVPSLSLTLDRLHTTTIVEFSPHLRRDELTVDRRRAQSGERRRASLLLDEVREMAPLRMYARVKSWNSFPTGAGLASSASGFAALAAAACAAANVKSSTRDLSRLARRSSASAGRSIFGRWVTLAAGTAGDDSLAARPLGGNRRWPIALVVGVVTERRKDIGSTRGMLQSRRLSPYYEAWLELAPRLERQIRAGVRRRDLDSVGRAAERSALAFHACAMTSDPGILYWHPATIAAMHAVRRLREKQILDAYFTIDAGPNVKVLCKERDAARVARALRAVPGMNRTIICRPGPGVVFGRGPLPQALRP